MRVFWVVFVGMFLLSACGSEAPLVPVPVPAQKQPAAVSKPVVSSPKPAPPAPKSARISGVPPANAQRWRRTLEAEVRLFWGWSKTDWAAAQVQQESGWREDARSAYAK